MYKWIYNPKGETDRAIESFLPRALLVSDSAKGFVYRILL